MKTVILLFCLLGSTQSLPKQLSSTLELPPTKPAPDQATVLNQPGQLNPVAGMAPGSKTLPLTTAVLNGQNQLKSQPLASQIFAGFLFHPLLPEGILTTNQVEANPDGQDEADPTIQGTPVGYLSTAGGTDDNTGVTTPAGIQRSTHTTDFTTTESPNGIH
ncbi:amelotin [Ctenodactylus gundi]